MIRAHRIALAPNDCQHTLLMQTVGYARFASNWMIDRLKAGIANRNEYLGKYDWRPAFNKVKGQEAPWARGLSQTAAKNAQIQTAETIERWRAYKKAKAAGAQVRHVGFPKYRKRGRHMSYTASNGRNTIPTEGKAVKLPCIGWVRMREELRLEGDIVAVTVSLKAGRWYASFTVEEDVPTPAKRPGPTVGIDMGLKTLAVVSDGETEIAYANPRLLHKALKELRTLDKAIARSEKAHGKTNPSKRRDHLYELRRNKHARIAGLRADHHHRITTAIAKQGGTVKVETLRVAGMSKAYGRSVADAGLAEFLRQLEYKCGLYGTEFVKAPWDFASTKTCSRCGCRKPPDGMPIWERTFRCDCCGLTLDRDRNAARNLQAFPGEIWAPVNCARRRHKTAGLPGRTARDVRNSASVSTQPKV